MNDEMGSPPSPPVATLVLNWNGYRETQECIDAVLRLDFPNNGVTIIDNGSTDDSERILRSMYPNVRFLQTGRNLGFAGGMNVGIRDAMARGAEFVWLLNNDARPEACSLQSLLDEMGDEAVGAAASTLVRPDGSIQCLGGGWIGWKTGRSGNVTNSSQTIDYLVGASLLIRTAALTEVGLLDERFFFYWEDADFSCRLKQRGWQLRASATSRVIHREGASVSPQGSKSGLADQNDASGMVRFFRKHGSWWVLPILIRLGGMTLNRIRRGQWNRLVPIWRGFLRGWSKIAG